MLNRNHKYIKFILEKLKNSLYTSGFDISESNANKALTFLMSSDDVLRDIFILSRYKHCGSLCSYLLFVYKKLDENSLKYENLPINIEYDVEYLKRIVIGSFKLNKSNEEAEVIEPMVSAESAQEWEVSGEISESKFKVGEIERDIVTEEFSEDEIDMTQMKDPEDEEKIEEIISVSLEEVKESFAGSDETDENEIQEEEFKSAVEDESEELKEEAFDLSDLIETIETKESEPTGVQNELLDDEKQTEDPEGVTEEKVFLDEESNTHIERETTDTSEEDLDDESILEISVEHLEVTEEAPKEKTIEYDSNQIKEENEIPFASEDEIQEDEPEETPIKGGKSKKFVDFENRLISINKDISLCFEEIQALSKSYDENNSVIKDKAEFISENALALEKATSEMTFEIISNMYNFIGNYFGKSNSVPFEIRSEDVHTFSNSLYIIEKFILEEDFTGMEKSLGDYFHIEKYVEEMERQKRTLEHIEAQAEITNTTSAEDVIETIEAIEEIADTEETKEQEIKIEERSAHEEKPSSEHKEVTESAVTENDSRRKLMMILKAEILELEIIFKSIDEIEGNYKIYEGLRKLSKTYNVLKKTVALSKRLDMNKLARLSEACYIFIKFIQNYRLSPFDNDIKQIFNYIIYNYKLIALDKPTKDFEEFVFYLNDPVKIFTQKKKI